jgi:hypothetical protein
MFDKIFGFKFGIKTSQRDHTGRGIEVKPVETVKPVTKTPLNIPPADDILDFSYTQGSPFERSMVVETSSRP